MVSQTPLPKFPLIGRPPKGAAGASCSSDAAPVRISVKQNQNNGIEMKAAVLTTQQTIQIKEVKQPQSKADEVLVAVKLTGICGSEGSICHGK